MKRIIKGFSIFILVVCSLLFVCPIETYALSNQNFFVSINDTDTTLNVGNIEFSNISFKDYSSISTKAFGISGIATNNYNKDINYTATVTYYDSSLKLITQSKKSGTIIEGTTSFSLMSNLDVLNGRNVKDIYCYSLEIDIDDSNATENNKLYTPSESYSYSSYDYVIDKYDVNIIVNENNTLDITETITAYFNVPKHGIYRTIPIRNTVTRLDGTTTKNRTQVTNIRVDNQYTTSRDFGDYKIKIGSENQTLTGEQTYTIKYRYNLGKDPIKGYDELYFNIIGTDWDTVIGNVTFSIKMPKEFDESKLGFSSGKSGFTNNSKVEYTVNGNTITGKYNGILDIGEALTVRCELNEGYFVGAGLTVNTMDYFLFAIPIVFLGISIFLWYKFGRDEQVVETVEFYPPQGFNSLEVGFLYKGKADSQDVISLLIYLANEGYIKIAETEQKKPFSKVKGFKITKLKEYDGNNINELNFLEGLFSCSKLKKESDQIDGTLEEVTSSELYDHFYKTTNEILNNINSKENKNKIFEKVASSKNKYIILMIIVAYCLISIPPIFTYGNPSDIFVIAFPMIGIIGIFSLSKRKSIISYILNVILLIIFFGMPAAIVLFPTLLIDTTYLIGHTIGLLCIIGMLIFLKILPKRTKYGNEMLGKIKGFRTFLETAEKDKLEAMVKQDPTYFYNILPYTYTLGVSNKWIKKFETMNQQAPSWYDSNNTFDMVAFGTFMNSTMVSSQSSMSSSSSSDSSSGGGSSGGGSGGGGGGSW